MNNFLTTIQKFTELNDFYSVLSFLREKDKAGEIVLYAGTYSIETALERFGNYDHASFYIYTTQDKKGYHIYLNRMGCGIVEDHKLFRFSHRYLYNKNHLSNCFFGEKDYRCGEFFNKNRRNKASIKDALLELALEIVLGIVTFFIGAFILNLISPDLLEGSADFAMFFGMVVLAFISSLVAIPIWLVKKHRKPKDIKRIFKALKVKHELELVIRNKKIDGVRKELYIVKGHSDEGMFELYKDGNVYIFSIEYFTRPVDEKFVTERLSNEADAIERIDRFMTEKIESKNEIQG